MNTVPPMLKLRRWIIYAVDIMLFIDDRRLYSRLSKYVGHMWLTHTLSDASNSRQNGKVRTGKIKLLFASEAVDDLKWRGSEHSAKKTKSTTRGQKYDSWFRFGHYRPILQSQTRILHIRPTHISTTLYRCHESQWSVCIPRNSEVRTVTMKFSVDLGSGLRNETRWQMASSEKKAMQWYRIMFLTRSVCFPRPS